MAQIKIQFSRVKPVTKGISMTVLMQGNPALTFINQGYQKLEPVTLRISMIVHTFISFTYYVSVNV